MKIRMILKPKIPGGNKGLLGFTESKLILKLMPTVELEFRF